MSDEDDIESCWRERRKPAPTPLPAPPPSLGSVRRSGGVKPVSQGRAVRDKTDPLNIEWRVARGLPPIPDFIYLARAGLGIRQMVLCRLTCLDEFETTKPCSPRDKARWVAEFESVLWCGSEYVHHPSTTPQTRCNVSKSVADLTLEDAVARLHVFAADYEHKYEESWKRLEEDEMKLRDSRKYVLARLEEAEGFSLSVSDLKVIK